MASRKMNHKPLTFREKALVDLAIILFIIVDIFVARVNDSLYRKKNDPQTYKETTNYFIESCWRVGKKSQKNVLFSFGFGLFFSGED